MPPDAARYAAMSDPEQNPAFRRLWEDPDPPPRPFVSVGEAVRRAMSETSEERLARQIREVFGE